jgi:predicted alpha/beta-hydrolase family hydrolase
VTFEWLESADHGYRPLKASGLTASDVVQRVAEVALEWVLSLR